MTSREERMQQRLRGAQRRQIKDVDFGLVFPAVAVPSEPDPSAQPELEQPEPQQPSTRRTPGHRSPSSPKVASSEKSVPITTHSGNDANTSAKRRKLDTDITPSTSRTTRSSEKAPRANFNVLPEDNTQTDASAVKRSVRSIRRAPASEPPSETAEIIATAAQTRSRTPDDLRAADEVTESPHNAPGSGQRIRANIDGPISASSQLQSIQNNSSIISEQTPLARKKRKRSTGIQPLLPIFSEKRSSRASRTSLDDDDLDELSPEQPKLRARSFRASARAHSPELLDSSIVKEPEELEEAEAIGDEEAAVVLKKNRGLEILRDDRAESPDLAFHPPTQELPIAKKKKRRPNKESPSVTQRQPIHPAAKIKAQAPKKFNKKQRVRAGSPIPITIHRLSQPLLFNEDEDGADILNMDIPYAKRKGVNAIDVLSQVCQEMVGSAMDTLEEGGNNCDDAALRREYKTKWNAVSSFGRELQSRLLEHTINLDNGYSLARRLRDEQKRKLGLREEILRVRAEREQVALRMDEVRARHEKEKTTALRRDTLNTAINDIELAVDLGKSTSNADETNLNDLVGTEFLLNRVASDVSSIGSSGGLLKHIKDFNAFLERAAQALEARKA